MDAVMQTLKANNLVVVPEKVAKYSEKFYKKRTNLLKRKWVSACAIADYDLLNTKPSRQTVRNMITDNRIFKTETYKNEKGVQMVLVDAIHRLNNN